jgi:thiosulfate/3-mercaptopyruvate sulfurtransferase
MLLRFSLASGFFLVWSTSLVLADDYPTTGLLIEAKALAKPDAAKHFCVLDARAKDKYLAGHIPGALWVDHDAWAKAFATGPQLAVWEKLIGGLALKHSTPVVIYDDGWAKNAAHTWWVLRYWGFEDVRLLNGGWYAWQQLPGFTQDRAVPHVNARGLKLRPIPSRLAEKHQVLELLKNRDEQIIDARPRAEFHGEVETARRKGAIPTAKHLEWSTVIDPQTMRFKPSQELARQFRTTGIDPAQPAVTYCRSGEGAAVMAFALELMGGPNVRNYYRGWQEWGNAKGTPVVSETTTK